MPPNSSSSSSAHQSNNNNNSNNKENEYVIGMKIDAQMTRVSNITAFIMYYKLKSLSKNDNTLCYLSFKTTVQP